MPLPVLRAKLLIPQMAEGHVKRKMLTNRFLRDFARQRQLTLVCAPAGYGKTTLILEALGELKLPCAWITLDESDNDVNRFLSYLVHAFRAAGVPVGESAFHTAAHQNLRALSTLMAEILEALAEFERELILVLDDYHVIREPQVGEAMRALLENQPPNLRLAVATREDPAFPLSRLRVSGRLTEIRMADLRFLPEEAEEYYLSVLGRELGGALCQRILRTTEGWAAGIQLMGLMLEGLDGDQAAEAVGRFGGTHRYIIDYLVEEVLRKQPQDLRGFLCRTSVLERMNAGLCQAVTGLKDSAALLARLQKANLFVSALDPSGEWYRYHPLFAEALRMELSPEEERLLRERAAAWMMDAGHYHEAVAYAFQAKNDALALKLVEGCTERVFQDAQLHSFLRWLEMLPPDMVRASEVVAVRKSIALLATGRFGEAVRHLHSLGPDFEARASAHNRGLIRCVQAMLASTLGRDAEREAREALALLEPWDPVARTSMTNTLGKSLFRKGRADDALRAFEEAHRMGAGMGYTLISTLALVNYGMCLNATGRMDRALELYRTYLDGMTARYGKPLPVAGIAYIALAGLFYDRDELSEAAAHLDRGVRMCESIAYPWLNSGVHHAYIRFAAGRREAALGLLEPLVAAWREGGPGADGPEAAQALAHLLLRSGDPASAERLGDLMERDLRDDTGPVRMEAAIGLARLALYRGAAEEAGRLLSEATETALACGRVRRRITILMLAGLAHARRGDGTRATEAFREALSLGGPGGYVRPFLDEEPALAELLRIPELAGGVRQLAWLRRLKDGHGGADRGKGAETLVEKPSGREMEILGLIASGKSNQEIAQALYISVNTTQWHISNLYGKLGVRSRTQALLRARELGLL